MTEEKKESQKKLQDKAKKFNEELIPLLEKHELILSATPFLTPQGTIAAKPELFDKNEIKQPETEVEKKDEDTKLESA